MRTILLLILLSFSLTSNAQLFGKKWTDGCYYDTLGVKHTGQINKPDIEKNLLISGGMYINYRLSKDDKTLKVYATAVKSLVVGQDSFAVSRDPQTSKTPFLKVLLDKTVKLYNVTLVIKSGMGGFGAIGLGYSYDNNVYYYGPDPNTLTKLPRKEFIKVMCELMSDKPQVVETIKKKTFSYSQMADLIKYYNTGIIPDNESSDNF